MTRFTWLAFIALAACSAALAEPSSPSTSSATLSPSEVCQKLVGMDQNQSTQWIYMGDRMQSDKTMATSKGSLKDDLSSASCSDEKIAGDHAMVTANTSTKSRFIPFIRQNGLWKLDMHAYRALYRMERTPASSDSIVPAPSTSTPSDSTSPMTR